MIQTRYLFHHNSGHAVHIFSLQHLSEQNHAPSPHLKIDWVAVRKLWLHLTQLGVPLTSWERIRFLAFSFTLKSNFSVCNRLLGLQSSKQQIFYPSLHRDAISHPQPLKLNMWSTSWLSAPSRVICSTKVSDCDTEPTYAAFNSSTTCLNSKAVFAFW